MSRPAPARLAPFQVTYRDRRGAGCVRTLPTLADAYAFLGRLYCEANVYDATGEKVGGIEDHDGLDDKRMRWFRWCES